jgi:hypothetical protein
MELKTGDFAPVVSVISPVFAQTRSKHRAGRDTIERAGYGGQRQRKKDRVDILP